MLAEEFIPGRELTCAVLGDRALDVIEITTNRGFARARLA
jgi:D-alanine-D-alanine ligase